MEDLGFEAGIRGLEEPLMQGWKAARCDGSVCSRSSAPLGLAHGITE